MEHFSCSLFLHPHFFLLFVVDFDCEFTFYQFVELNASDCLGELDLDNREACIAQDEPHVVILEQIIDKTVKILKGLAEIERLGLQGRGKTPES